MSKAFDYIADIFLPNRCPCCGSFIRWDGLICEECRKGLALCENSAEIPPEGCSAAVSVFVYDGCAKQGIYSLKDGCGKGFAVCGAELLAERLNGSGAELVTCVPMARRKRAERGYNQAELIASELAKRLGLECDPRILTRRPTSLEQHDLSAADRNEFAKTLYGVSKKHRVIAGMKLILVDDVHTTGATLAACAQKLLSLGASEVLAATLCRAVKKEKE